jgi:chromosomal replication initiation ATPase DnaA
MLAEIGKLEPRRTGVRFRKLRSDRDVFLLAQIVASEGRVCLTKLLRPSRGHGRTTRARQITIYLAHVLLGRTQENVAELFRRDRTTIAHAVRMMEERRDDPALDRLIGRIEARFLRMRLEQAGLCNGS